MDQVRDTRAGYEPSGTPVILAPGMAVEFELRGKRHSGYVAKIDARLVWVRPDTNEPVIAVAPRDLRIVPSETLKPSTLLDEARRLVQLASIEAEPPPLPEVVAAPNARRDQWREDDESLGAIIESDISRKAAAPRTSRRMW